MNIEDLRRRAVAFLQPSPVCEIKTAAGVVYRVDDGPLAADLIRELLTALEEMQAKLAEAERDSERLKACRKAHLLEATEQLHAVEELRAVVEALRLEVAALQWVANCAHLLAVHVNGHFACPSSTSPAVCLQWAETTQAALAAIAQEKSE